MKKLTIIQIKGLTLLGMILIYLVPFFVIEDCRTQLTKQEVITQDTAILNHSTIPDEVLRMDSEAYFYKTQFKP